MGQLFGCTCQSSEENPIGMILQMCTKLLRYLISSTISTLLPVHLYIESKSCFTTLQHMSNCETEQFNHLSNPIYKEVSSPGSQKICYLLETNSIFHFRRSREMNIKDCWVLVLVCWGGKESETHSKTVKGQNNPTAGNTTARNVWSTSTATVLKCIKKQAK